jgi:isoleucyl-tRNA synthetase
MALAVNKDLEYVIVESDSVQFVVAKNRVETVFKGK